MGQNIAVAWEGEKVRKGAPVKYSIDDLKIDEMGQISGYGVDFWRGAYNL